MTDRFWTEAAIAAALEGTFTVVDSSGRISTIRVAPNFVPPQHVTPAPRPRAGGSPMRWKAHEDRVLRTMRAVGATYVAIAEHLGRSDDSIRTRIKLLKRRGRWE